MIYDVEIVELPPQTVATLRFPTEPQDAVALVEQALTEVFTWIEQQGGLPAGPPFTRAHHVGIESEIPSPPPWDLEVGFPVEGEIEETDDIRKVELPGGRAATTLHRGHYRGLADAYLALQVWIESQGLRPNGPPWEQYLVDPAAEIDPDKWEMQVYWPLKD